MRVNVANRLAHKYALISRSSAGIVPLRHKTITDPTMPVGPGDDNHCAMRLRSLECGAATFLRIPNAMAGQRVLVRPLMSCDVDSLVRLVTSKLVSQFVAPPPASVEAWQKFVTWAQRERAADRQLCLAIVPRGAGTAAGLIQIRRDRTDAATAEWGFLLAQHLWGTGIFIESATLAIDALFAAGATTRLEAKTAASNRRAAGALKKIGCWTSPNEDITVGEQSARTVWLMTASVWRRCRPDVAGA